MLQHQHKLPRLPVPSLAASATRYRAAVAVYSTPAQLAATDVALRAFLGPSGGTGKDGEGDGVEEEGEGAPLQRELLARAAAVDAAGSENGVPSSSSSSSGGGASYIGAFWDRMYLEGRWPLCVHSNPAGIFTPGMWTRSQGAPTTAAAAAAAAVGAGGGDSGGGGHDAGGGGDDDDVIRGQAARAGWMLRATLDFGDRIRRGSLAPDVFGKAGVAMPIDMAQYNRMFGMTRLPGGQGDTLVQAAGHGMGHAVLLRGGRMWRIPLLQGGADGAALDPAAAAAPLSAKALTALVQAVVDEADALPPLPDAEAVGALTTEDRDVWAAARASLLDPGGCGGAVCLPQHGAKVAAGRQNAAALAAVDGAFVLLCLDDEGATRRVAADVLRHRRHADDEGEEGATVDAVLDYATFEECLDTPDKAAAAGASKALALDACLRQMLHGDMRNRWFDKSLSLVVTAGGACGMAFEHSWGDGVCAVRWGEEMAHFIGHRLCHGHGHGGGGGGGGGCDDGDGDDDELGELAPSRIRFALGEADVPGAPASIAQALAKADGLTAALDLRTVLHEGWGVAAAKAAGVSPDGAVQQVIQLAYHLQVSLQYYRLTYLLTY